jgi:hypothetical protein
LQPTVAGAAFGCDLRRLPRSSSVRRDLAYRTRSPATRWRAIELAPGHAIEDALEATGAPIEEVAATHTRMMAR